MAKKLTPRMLEVLRHAKAGRPLDSGVTGMAAYGGFSRTVVALTCAGLLTPPPHSEITDAGRAAIAKQEPTRGS